MRCCLPPAPPASPPSNDITTTYGHAQQSRHPPPISQQALFHQCSCLHRSPPLQGLLPHPPLLNHPDCLNPLSGLITTHTFVPALSVTHKLTGRANNARKTPLICYPPVSFFGLTFTTAGRHLGLRPFDPSPTFLGGPWPRRESSAPYNQRRHRSSRSPAAHAFLESSPCDYIAAPHFIASYLRISVDATVGPTHMPPHHLLPLGCCSDTQQLYPLLVVGWHRRLHPLVAPPLPQVSCAQDFAPNNSLAHPLPAATKRPRYPRQRRLFRARTHHASGQSPYPPVHRPFQPPRRHIRHH